MPATGACVIVIWSAALAEMNVPPMFAPAIALVAVSEQWEAVVTPGMLTFVDIPRMVVSDAMMGILAPLVPPVPTITGLLLSVFRNRAALALPVSMTRLSSAS